MDEISLTLSHDDILHGKKKLRAIYSVVEEPVWPHTPAEEWDDVVDEIVADALAQAARDYDALPRWKKRWLTFLSKAGLWRVDRFLHRYTPSALRLRWYYWRHRKEMREEYGD